MTSTSEDTTPSRKVPVSADTAPLRQEMDARSVQAPASAADDYYHALFWLAPDAYLVTDLTATIREANLAATTLLGLGAAALVGQSVLGLITPMCVALCQSRLRHIHEMDAVSDWDMRLQRPDAPPIDVAVRVVLIHDAVGQPSHLHWSLRDISQPAFTERRLALQYAVSGVLLETGNLDAAAPQVLQTIGEALGWDLGVLWLLDEPNQVLRSHAVWHPVPVLPSTFLALTREMSFPRGMGLPGHVWDRGEPVWAPNILATPNSVPRAHAAAAAGLQSAFAFPIRSDQRILGIVEFFAPTMTAPDTELLQTVATLGNQLGQFIGRRRAEEEGARLAHDLRLLLDSTGEGIYGIDTGGRCTFINTAGAQLLGYRVDEVIGRDMHQLIHHSCPDGSPYPAEDCPITQAIEQQHGCRVDDDVLWRRDGTTFAAGYSSFPIVDGSGIAGAVVTFNDITARKAVEAELRYQLDLNRAITANTAEALFLMDRDGRTTFVNPAAEELFGWRAVELLGTVLHDQIHSRRPDGTPYPIQNCPLGDVFRSGRPLRAHEDWFVHKDGSFIPVACSNMPIVVDGTVTGAVLAVSDITARTQADAERAAHSTQLESVAAASVDINAARSLDALLQAITEQARSIIPRCRS